MPQLAHRLDDGVPLPAAPRPALRALPRPPRRRLRPTAHGVAAYAAGLALGFLLVAPASLPAGVDMAAGQLRLAAICAGVAGLAALRARAVARRRARAGGPAG